MRDFIERLKINQIWNIAVYVEDRDFSFPSRIGSPTKVLNARKLRTGKNHLHTYADPFLFRNNGDLYMFYESQASNEEGKIEAVRTSDLETFEPVGEVLREPWHLSYPFVFRAGDEVFMIPESLDVNQVSLYRFENFPHEPRKVRDLLTGHYKDSSMVFRDGVWYLFTATADGLEIWMTEDLVGGELRSHPLNPLTRHPKYFRCGGGPIEVGGKLFRISQDGSLEYGRNISVMRIDELTPTGYRETLIVDDYFELGEDWNSRGGHHLSVAEFKDKLILAVDGKQDDFFVNKFLSLVYSR